MLPAPRPSRRHRCGGTLLLLLLLLLACLACLVGTGATSSSDDSYPTYRQCLATTAHDTLRYGLVDWDRRGVCLRRPRCRDVVAVSRHRPATAPFPATTRACSVQVDGLGPVPENFAAGAALSCEPGHYRPPNSCVLRNVLVGPRGDVLVPIAGVKPAKLDGGSVFDLWNVRHHQHHSNSVVADDDDASMLLKSTTSPFWCERISGPVVAFSFYYHYGSGNYYHFVYDTLLPLFALLEGRGWLLPPLPSEDQRVLWPTVEHGGLVGYAPGVDWTTDAFARRQPDGARPFWHAALRSIFPDWELRPLTNATLDQDWVRAAGSDGAGRRTCVRQAVFGLPKTNFADAQLVKRFVTFLRARLALPPQGHVVCTNLAGDTGGLRAAFVRRSNRRRVLNHEALVSIMRERFETDVLRLERLPFREQLRRMGDYALLVGMQGAGLINGLFLPAGAHVVVLFQYNAASDSFAQLLRPRVASYRRWVNVNKENSFNDPEKDPFHDIADTIVDEAEFRMIVDSVYQRLCEGGESRSGA